MPVLTVIAGPNGSGKSSLIAALRAQGVELGAYFNADDIAAGLTGSPDEVARRAQQIVRDNRSEALAKGRDHSFETVMSHISHVDYMLEAQLSGFEVRLFFVSTDKPEINVGRVKNRVEHGGHNVPQDRIISRYFRCLDNLPSALAVSDHAWIFDNSQFDLPHRLLATISNRQLTHDRNTRQGTMFEHLAGQGVGHDVNPEDIPAWWLTVLLEIKPSDPFIDGQLV